MAGSERSFVYRLDGDDRIVFVSDEWLAFARENACPDLHRDNVLNRSLWEFVSDATTRHLYELVFEEIRARGRTLSLPFRCDSPDRRRFMQLDASPGLERAIHLHSRLLREEPRERLELLDPAAERSGDLLRICSWCKQVQAEDGSWHEAELAIARLDLFGAPRLPQLTHVTCDACEGRARAELAGDEAGPRH